MAENRLGSPVPPVEEADNGLDLELRLGWPLPQDVAAALPVLAPALPDWPPTLRLASGPNPAFLITRLLDPYLMRHYFLVPANLRNEIVVLNEYSFFALDHNQMLDEFYFCDDNVPHRLNPWTRTEGRIVYTNSNPIGRFATYHLGKRVRFTRYTSILPQQGRRIALYRIRARG